MLAGERVKHELPLFKMPFSKMMSSAFKLQPDNCPKIKKNIDMQIVIRNYII